jgi:Reverse transcriptase (RNA-dependent DNA polymerase)
MEFLSKALTGAQTMGRIKSVQVAEGAPVLSHLKYADDLLLFGATERSEIHAFKDILDSFGRASGLVVNPTKSTIWFSKQCPENSKQEVLMVFQA